MAIDYFPTADRLCNTAVGNCTQMTQRNPLVIIQVNPTRKVRLSIAKATKDLPEKEPTTPN